MSIDVSNQAIIDIRPVSPTKERKHQGFESANKTKQKQKQKHRSIHSLVIANLDEQTNWQSLTN